MSFFDSEIVQKEMRDIHEIQMQIGKELFAFPSMPKEEKIRHISLLSDLLEKQQVLYTRISLSDDPQALVMKEQMIESSKMLGFGNADVNTIFNSMKMTIENLKKHAEVDR
jgi:hypothetical protein